MECDFVELQQVLLIYSFYFVISQLVPRWIHLKNVTLERKMGLLLISSATFFAIGGGNCCQAEYFFCFMRKDVVRFANTESLFPSAFCKTMCCSRGEMVPAKSLVPLKSLCIHFVAFVKTLFGKSCIYWYF